MLKEDDSFTRTPSKEGVQDVSLESRLAGMLEMFESKLSAMDERIKSISGSSNTLRAASEQFIRLQNRLTLYLRTGSSSQVLSPARV